MIRRTALIFFVLLTFQKIMLNTRITYSVPWNLFLITAGSIIIAVALKGIAFHHAFIPGGIFGASSLVYFVTGVGRISFWYLLFNIPLFVIAWKFISKRFLWYSLYAMLFFTGVYYILDLKFPAFSWTPSGCGEIYIINKNRLLIKKLQIHNLLILL